MQKTASDIYDVIDSEQIFENLVFRFEGDMKVKTAC